MTKGEKEAYKFIRDTSMSERGQEAFWDMADDEGINKAISHFSRKFDLAYGI